MFLSSVLWCYLGEWVGHNSFALITVSFKHIKSANVLIFLCIKCARKQSSKALILPVQKKYLLMVLLNGAQSTFNSFILFTVSKMDITFRWSSVLCHLNREIVTEKGFLCLINVARIQMLLYVLLPFI